MLLLSRRLRNRSELTYVLQEIDVKIRKDSFEICSLWFSIKGSLSTAVVNTSLLSFPSWSSLSSRLWKFSFPKKLQSCLECLRLLQVKLLWQRFCHSGKRGPGNETLKKRKELTAFYDRFQPSAGPGNNCSLGLVHNADRSHHSWRGG